VVLASLLFVSRAGAAATSYLPGAAETHGLNNAVFSSTLVVSNVGAAAASVSIGFIPYEGKGVPASVSRSLAAGQTLRIEHVLQELFGLGGDAGTLTVTSDAPLALSLTTANIADPAGTFGLALLPASGATLLTSGETGHAIWAAQDDAYRSNVALTLLDPNSLVDVVVLDEQAGVLGKATVASAQPVSWQSSLPALTGGRLTSVARVELRVNAGRVAGYTAVVDNVTNDGIAVQAASLTAASVDYLLDGIVRTAGRNGTYFQTDVRLFNPNTEPLSVSLEALGYRTGTRTISRLLPPRGVVEIRDLLGPAGFDLGDGLAGAVRFRASAPFLVAGRTNNIDPSGQRAGSFSVYQQPVPYPSALVFSGQRAVVAGIDQTSAFPGFRTNLAFFAGPSGAAGRLVLRDAAGPQTATASFSLDGGAWVQRSSSDWFDGAAIPPGSRIEVEVTSGSLDAYAARVDNGTGDGVVLTAQAVPGAAGCAVPAISSFTATPTTGTPGGEVTLTLASTGGASAVINPGNLAIPPNGSLKVKPSATTTYTATVIGSCAPSAVAAASVSVAPANCAPPALGLFTATPDVVEPGDAVVLRLSADAASAAVVSPGGIQLPAKGFVVVHPTETTTFRAYAAGDCGAAGAGATVTVVPGLPTVLNEMLFDPPGGEPPFVELKVGSAGAPLSQLALKNQAGEVYTLPANLPQPDPRSIVLVLFDGKGFVEGRTIHADRTGFLDRAQGTVALQDVSGAVLDSTSWGRGGTAVPRGGIRPTAPGTTIGRLAASRQPGGEGWTFYEPAEASPGAANPYAAVTIVPFAASVLTPDAAESLSWYPAPGAVRYRFQLARDPSFGELVVDRLTDYPGLELALPAGSYYGRIASLFPDGIETPSETFALFSGRPGGSGRRALADPKEPLRVPVLHQRKDTRMLLLESNHRDDAHAWDRPHPATDDGAWLNDPVCAANCCMASVAMIENYLGGKLSQDYLAYLLYSKAPNTPTGPELDGNWGFGLNDADAAYALGLALRRGAPVPIDVYFNAARLWDYVKREIDGLRPVMATWPGHCVVIVGYDEAPSALGPDRPFRYLYVNEPSSGLQKEYIIANGGDPNWNYGQKWQLIFPLGDLAGTSLIDVPGGLNTPEDADKILDFDKTKRFCVDGRCLDPGKDDTDDDCVKDKDEVRRSVFGKNGWSKTYTHNTISGTARDADGNGTPPELTKTDQKGDSDGGGVPDYVEDLNRDGMKDPQETDPFDRQDDERKIEGTWRHVSSVFTGGFPAMVGYETVHNFNQEVAELKLQTKPDGTVTGKAKIEIDRLIDYKYTQAYSPQCPLTLHYVWEHVAYEGDVTGTWACDPEGARLNLSAGSKRTVKITITNTCNDSRLEQPRDVFGLSIQALFKTKEQGKDTRKVTGSLSLFGGGSTVSGSNTETFDLKLTASH